MQNKPYHAVIFDVDGLIVDTEAIYCRTFNETLGKPGAEFKPEDYTRCVGHPVEENSVYAVEQYGLTTTPEAFCADWMARFEQAISDPDQIALMPGFLDLFAHIREKNYRLGIASSTQRPRMLKTLRNGVLTRLNGVQSLDDVFSVILSGSDVAKTKPAPDIYLLAAERLGVAPGHCLVFEDSEAGVKAAKTAGMTVFAVPNFFTAHQDHAAADRILKNLREAIPHL